MRTAWNATGCTVALFTVFGAMVLSELPGKPSLGDWGSFLQAAAATLAFIWLVCGQYQNQSAIRDNQQRLEDQMEITRELVGALTRSASGNQVQAAEILTEAMPRFTHVGSTGTPVGRGAVQIHPTSGYVAFLNEGGGVTLLSVESKTVGLQAKLEPAGACPSGKRFKIWLSSEGQLRTHGAMTVVVVFKDKFERIGSATIRIHSFEKAPEVITSMGSPPR